jgi:hypothetical protein
MDVLVLSWKFMFRLESMWIIAGFLANTPEGPFSLVSAAGASRTTALPTMRFAGGRL